MKLDIQLQAGSRTEHHQLELPSGATGVQNSGGRLTFRLDGKEVEADWTAVAPGVYSFLVGGQSLEVQVTTPAASAGTHDNRWAVSVGTRNYVVAVRDPRRHRHAGPAANFDGPQEILAPMPGKIVKVLVEENQKVSQGTGLLVIEAMKMQNELRAPRSGRVEKIYVGEATGVETGSKLIRLV